jgi:hypothetical protein
MIYTLLEKRLSNFSGDSWTWVFQIEKADTGVVARIRHFVALLPKGGRWSRVRTGAQLYRWFKETWNACEPEEGGLTRGELAEIGKKLTDFDRDIEFDFVAEHVKNDIRAALDKFQRLPIVPTLEGLLSAQVSWLDSDGGGGGEYGYEFRDYLRRSAISKLLSERLSRNEPILSGVSSIEASYGPLKSNADIISRHASAVGAIKGRIEIPGDAYKNAANRYHEIILDDYVVVVGVSSAEAGWLGNYPRIKRFKRLDAAAKYFDKNCAEAKKAFHSDINGAVFGIFCGRLLATDVQSFTSWLLKRDLGGKYEPVAGTEIDWHPSEDGFGTYSASDFDERIIEALDDYLS